MAFTAPLNLATNQLKVLFKASEVQFGALISQTVFWLSTAGKNGISLPVTKLALNSSLSDIFSQELITNIVHDEFRIGYARKKSAFGLILQSTN